MKWTIIFLLVSTFYLTNVNAQDWKKITLFYSTREDVELIFGKSLSTNTETGGSYRKDNYAIATTYSYGNCTDKYNSGWNVPTGTVIGMTISFPKGVNLKDFNLNVSDYERINNTHQTSIYSLRNKEEAIVYVISELDGKVYSIEYHSREQNEGFRCSNNCK